GQAHPHPAAHRRALPRANGAAPRGRVLFALICARGALEIAAVLIGGRPWALRAQPPSSIEKSWYSHRAAVGAAGVCDSTSAIRLVVFDLGIAGNAALGRRAFPDRPALVLQQALQFARLKHFADDVAAADEFALDVKLRDRGPIGVGLDALAQVVRFEHVQAL